VKEYLAHLIAEAATTDEAGSPGTHSGLRGEFGEETQKHVDEKIAAIGKTAFYDVIRRLALQTNDMFWVDHLELMDYARSSVNLRAYGQRDPLVEYKREALRLYKEMEETIAGQILSMIPRIQVSAFMAAEAELKKVESQMTLAGGSQSSVTSHQSSGNTAKKEPGRNDPCWCGAKKVDGTPMKYKHCHGKNS
jgi:preprotein translocase subunit SecA